MSATLDLLKELIAKPSITPRDLGCQEIIGKRLEKLGFKIETINIGTTENIWARKGDAEPLFCFAGHTDVVPPGDENEWTSNPFIPTERDGFLYGRGACDMKAGVAAMVTATESFLTKNSEHQGSIAFLITSNEEGDGKGGTKDVVDVLEGRNEKIDHCIVGEPTSVDNLGDMVKNGRRGSLNGWLTIHGVQGHVAYPHRADNPIHKAPAVLDALLNHPWDKGNEYFDPTSFQLTTINAGDWVTNTTPADIKVAFNWRYSSEVTAEELQQQLVDIVEKHGVKYTVEWQLSGKPFLTRPDQLVDATVEAIEAVCGNKPVLSTTGGTSDARFIAPTGASVLEFGPTNESMHKVDEYVKIDELDKLSKVYELVLEKLLRT